VYRKETSGETPRDAQDWKDRRYFWDYVYDQHERFVSDFTDRMGYTEDNGWERDRTGTYQATAYGPRWSDVAHDGLRIDIECKSGAVGGSAATHAQLEKIRDLLERDREQHFVCRSLDLVTGPVQARLMEMKRDFPDLFRFYEFSTDPVEQERNWERERAGTGSDHRVGTSRRRTYPGAES
jgi:hypothetical protein